ncbi:RagB/SusD family nutrient uptake outer membrane protein [Fodinibius sediminis]|uniref:Starch-binding associating with outer membrane n=1 Tax=Fodinibius sediminis TaxID=1214077 RepID=A0A521C694_9BACT|nr:RagB/SusD family nutrient uptake outer membrane protein [Fodinibius sediminis]SMO54976.1 Starch-binding associating with outer membrane [Fodinibius sediminis]
MKKFNLHITAFAVMVFALFLYSCDTGEFLSTPAKGSLSEDVLANEQGANALLVGAYAALDGQNISGTWSSGGTNWVYGSVAGGDAHKGSIFTDQTPINSIMDMSHNAANGFFNDFWTTRYEGVSRANSVIALAPQLEGVDDATKARIEGEGRFLRGHYYFELKKMFNNVPWIDEETTEFKVPNTGETAASWADIEADFQYAYDNLPEVQSQVGRANKWAAASYLAKAYVFQGKWSEADALLQTIINQGVNSSGEPYALQDNYADNFRADRENSSETVFSIQYTGPDGTGTIDNSRQEDMLNYPFGNPFNCCGFYQPTQELVNSYRTNAITGLPILDGYNDEMVKNDMGIESSEPFTIHEGPLDPRLDHAVGRRGVPYLDWGPFRGKEWIREQSYGGPYHAQKHVYRQENASEFGNRNEWAPGSAVNYDVIRFADVLLWAAEAKVELGNDLNRARELVNRVRGRVADDTYGDGWVDYTDNQPFALATVDSESEMTALDANPGEWVIRTDTESTFILLKGDPGNADNWQEYENPNYTVSIYPPGHPYFLDQARAREAVHFERKLELSLEGHRFFDLVRWGEAKQTLEDFYQYEGGELGFNDFSGASFTEGKNEYYPIPQTQIDITSVNGEPTLEQNPGY